MTDARSELLEAAAHAVGDSGEFADVFRMPVARVLELSSGDYTRGTFTHHWPRRLDFENDLILHLAEGVRDRALDRLDTGLTSIVDSVAELSFEDVFGSGIEMACRATMEDRDFPIVLGLWAHGLNRPEVVAVLRENWNIIDDSLAQHLRLLVAAFHRRISPESSYERLAMSLGTMVNSFAVRMAVMGDGDEFNARMRRRDVLALVSGHTVKA